MTEQHPITPASQSSSIDLPELSLRITEEGWTEVTFARDPKPPSLSDSALDLIDRIEYNAMTKNAGNEKAWNLEELEVVRHALKRLQWLEGQGDG